jgi:hypothetical protein
MIRVDGAEGLVDSEIPFYVYGNPDLGPTVSVMAGVHGCEYVPMMALRTFLDEFDESQLRGSLRVVPILTTSPAVAADGLLLGLGVR